MSELNLIETLADKLIANGAVLHIYHTPEY